MALVLIGRQDCLCQPTHVLRVLSRAEAPAGVAVFHLLLRDNGLIILLGSLVIRFLDDRVKRVEVWVACGHGLTRSWRYYPGGYWSFLLRKSAVLRSHVLLLAYQTIQALDIIWAELIVLRVAVPSLHVGGAACHVLELNVI